MFKLERLCGHLSARKVSRDKHSGCNRYRQEKQSHAPLLEDQLTDAKQRTIDQHAAEYPIGNLQREPALRVLFGKICARCDTVPTWTFRSNASIERDQLTDAKQRTKDQHAA